MLNSLKSQKFVIAGGSGFLGISLARHLTERGASVVILCAAYPKSPVPGGMCFGTDARSEIGRTR